MMAHVEVQPGVLEIRDDMGGGPRGILLAAGLVALAIAWDTATSRPLSAIVIALAAFPGAFGLAFTLVAVMAPSASLRFEVERQLLVVTRRATFVPARRRQLPFADIVGVELETTTWSDGPDSHSVRIRCRGSKPLLSGSFTNRETAAETLDLVRSLLETSRPGSERRGMAVS